MANFSVNPQALVFNKTTVQGSVAGLFQNSSQTLTFTFTNSSGASVTITGAGFTTSTEGDGVTLPQGQLPNSDFVIVPTGGSFPVTVTNAGTQSFTVTFQPVRKGTGFGDVRSAILVLFAGNKALSNGGQTINSSGEVINDGRPKLLTVGVGGAVVDMGYDNARTAPIFWTGGSAASQPGEVAVAQGMNPGMTLADLDTTAHYAPMMFFAANQTNSAGESALILPAAAVSSSQPPYGTLTTPAINGSPRGGKSYQILVFAHDDTLVMDITIRAITTAGSHVVVATFLGVTYKTASGLFVGNNEGLDLQGLSLTCQTNVTAGATVPYNVGAVRTS